MDFQEYCGGNLTDAFSSGSLPQCDPSSIFLWIPILFTILVSPALLFQAKRVSRRFEPLPYSFLLVCKICLSVVLTGINLLVLIYNIVFLGPAVEYGIPLLITVAYALMTFGHLARKRSGMVTSGIQHISAFLFLLAGTPELYHRITQRKIVGQELEYRLDTLYVAFLHYYVFLLAYNVLLCFADPRNKNDKVKKSPELDSSFLNRLVHGYFSRITSAAKKKDLKLDDLFDVNPGSTTAALIKLWEKRLFSQSDWVTICSLISMFKYEVLLAFCLKLMSDVLQLANPFLLHHMISYFSKEDSHLAIGLLYAALMFGFAQARSFILNYYFYTSMRMGFKFQTTVIAAVYKKALTLSNSARRDKSVGEVVNLMSDDADKIYVFTAQWQMFWSMPFQIIMATIYLFFTLGWPTVVVIGILALATGLNYYSSKLIQRWEQTRMKLKDERTKMMSEVLNGIKVIKLYAWEIPMEEHIEEIRKEELKLVWRINLLRAVFDTLNTVSPFIATFFTFLTFVLSDPENKLTPQVAFVALTLFNMLRVNMAMVTTLIGMWKSATVSGKRLKDFFKAEELDKTIVERLKTEEYSAKMENFDATWDTEEQKRNLADISMSVRKGGLLAVVGKVGCGKSSLLSALLGEMGKLRGRIGVSGKLAYVPQQAWIQNMTVRDNILFGRAYDKDLYQKVLKACALNADLKILPHGDKTEIGEKGINLSGGQKARISLARAVYQDYDVYLLDDPLSAVDTHVGKHIFEQVIGPNGLLKDKTRILVTHGLSYTLQADEIIVLEDGKIVESGIFTDLLAAKGRFYKFLKDAKGTEEKKKEEDMEEVVLNEFGNEVRTRADSILSTSVMEVDDNQKLIKDEGVESGSVKMAVYWMYIKAASVWKFLFFIVFAIAFQAFQVSRSYWLSKWSMSYQTNSADVTYYLTGYATLGGCEAICQCASNVIIVFAGLNASVNLHSPLLRSILRSPMSFFDTTPLGRILNRFSQDFNHVDSQIPGNFRTSTTSVLTVLAAVIAIGIANPSFLLVAGVLGALYYYILQYYVYTSRQLMRLEATMKSPIFSYFGETLQGTPSIRAFDKVGEFERHAGHIVDRFVRCKYLWIVSTRWLAVRLEFIGNIVIFSAALIAVLTREMGYTESPGIVGVSISYAMSIADSLNNAVRSLSLMESNIVSVERINDYTETPNEAEWEVEERKPVHEWPLEGEVNFKRYSTRYRPGLDLVLREISANVASGEKIGIVGRTGAGKSSFALALFRLIEPAGGEILIDGVDVSQIGLHSLRSALTIIPQDPVLFSGTLRFNLDPFNRRQDDEIWQALELAHLKEMASSFEKGLSHRISEGGENISVGQRQLVCLARALLRHTKILVLDEATAAVDVATDALIQATIRTQFKDCTVFTIAHRLNTILDYDRIMVLDKGEIAEFDSPANLLEDRDTIFSKMIADSKNEESH